MLIKPKKILFIVLILTLMAAMCGCGENKQSSTDNKQTISSEQQKDQTETTAEDDADKEQEKEKDTASSATIADSGLGKDVSMSAQADALNITADNYPRIDGSTSTLGIVQTIYRNMVDNAEETSAFPETASKTVPSYQRLIQGDADMILVPYASETVLQQAADAGVELEFTKVAAEALIFITAADNPTESITLEQVRDIYLDYGIDNWQELGGPDKELIPICRNADSGSQSQMDNLILDNQPMDQRIQDNFIELTMESMLEEVAFYHTGDIYGNVHENCFALGYTLYNYLQNVTEITGIGDRLKILHFDGIMPTEENIADGFYPLADGYYAVVRSDMPADDPARAIIKWLQSETGCAAVQEAGFIPCNALDE